MAAVPHARAINLTYKQHMLPGATRPCIIMAAGKPLAIQHEQHHRQLFLIFVSARWTSWFCLLALRLLLVPPATALVLTPFLSSLSNS